MLNYKQQTYFQFIVLVLLLSLTWSNVVSCCFNNDTCAFELFDPFDGESENEEQKSEEKMDDKIRSYQMVTNLLLIEDFQQFLLSIEFKSLHYPEIHTPPPKPSVYFA